ncbi:hypothetical protein RB195_017894 [Necator americanus]|uniref:GPI ethanolamine phosphate transferase 2 C-terminal domain-containing protein n=1 Tax=Necator americanus TaxID=51031 RepID=A0ABR1CAD0_NECAM
MLVESTGIKDTGSLRFLVAFGSLLLAVLFICYGFAVGGEVYTKPVVTFESDFQECFEEDLIDHLVDVNTKIVLMVVDAWRLSFFVDPDSPMTFLRNSVTSGRGVAFAATVQTPTVTMPRIKALTSGVIPSFISLVTNFFASASTEINWVNSASVMGKRIAFFGDDTWLRLFPDAFVNSEGVSSFFVNDFTEVDNNVTRHLDSKLNNDSWDMLILHYLGLDHIGHSLGGVSPEFAKKIREMDNIAQRIFETVSVHSPVLLVVMADHGMTSAGSHGGGSEAESRVPLIFLHSKVEVKRGGILNELPEVQQIDLASTIPFFLNCEIPSSSIGLSLVPRLAEHWRLSDLTIFKAALQSAVHFSKFVEDPALRRLHNVDAVKRCQEAKAYSNYVQSSAARGITGRAQESLIKSQEQVLGWPMYVGVALVVLAFIAVLPISWFRSHVCSNAHSKQITVNPNDYMNYIVFGLYHISSYSTSFIEEEHDVWYYISSSIILFRIFIIIKCHGFIRAQQIYCDTKFRAGCVLLSLHRLAVAFTAHTRRHLLPQPVVPEFRSHVSLIEHVFADLNPVIICKWSPSITTTICVCYILCRIQPRKAMSSMWRTLIPYSLSVLICLRVAFNVGQGYMIFLILAGVLGTLVTSFSLGTLLYLCYLVRAETLPLVVISFELGASTQLFTSSPYLYAFFCQTVFFYQGQSSNISSIDIAIGYKGLSFYIAALVGFQILVNFYAAPFAFTIGYLTSSQCSKSDYVSLLNATLRLRSLILFSSLVGMITLSGHLFIFSVVAPKLICELLHLNNYILHFTWLVIDAHSLLQQRIFSKAEKK